MEKNLKVFVVVAVWGEVLLCWLSWVWTTNCPASASWVIGIISIHGPLRRIWFKGTTQGNVRLIELYPVFWFWGWMVAHKLMHGVKFTEIYIRKSYFIVSFKKYKHQWRNQLWISKKDEECVIKKPVLWNLLIIG